MTARSALRGRRAGPAMRGLTPFLDTIFLLLFALLATGEARGAARSELLHVDLPAVEPSGGRAPSTDRRLVLVLDADARVSVQDPEHGPTSIETRDELDHALATRLGDGLPEDVVIEIQADRQVPHGAAVDLLQHLRLRGFVRIQLVVAGQPGRGGPFGGPR